MTSDSDPDFYAPSFGTLGVALHVSFFNHFLLVEVIQQPIRIIVIESYWSCHGEQIEGYHMKEDKSLYQKLVSKAELFNIPDWDCPDTV